MLNHKTMQRYINEGSQCYRRLGEYNNPYSDPERFNAFERGYFQALKLDNKRESLSLSISFEDAPEEESKPVFNNYARMKLNNHQLKQVG